MIGGGGAATQLRTQTPKGTPRQLLALTHQTGQQCDQTPSGHSGILSWDRRGSGIAGGPILCCFLESLGSQWV